ncbi:MAG: queuosine 5'-phosphate N-glycosylase/hydrolase [Planctomycetota bacterium]|jgi:hypothetical protein
MENDKHFLERVRPETARVVEGANHVKIDREAAARLAQKIEKSAPRTPDWDKEKQWADGTEQTAQWVFVLDSLNFCFWPDAGKTRWTVEWGGAAHRGYFALSCALKRAQTEGVPITDATFLADIEKATLSRILEGNGTPSLLEERAAILRENGAILLDKWEGSFARVLHSASGSAAALVDLLLRDFPSFRDVHLYRGESVHILKRVQILVSDLWGAFDGAGLGAFDDLDRLTAFADYRVPQILRSLGILRYSDRLSRMVDEGILIPSGAEEEVELRAATVQGVEVIAEELRDLGLSTNAFEIDWLLWNESHHPDHNKKPYHLTRSIWY